MNIDLNCDLGEGGSLDSAVMPWITSANISCGFHAGDDTSVTEALRLAAQHDVQVGAHPGYPDREHFGRRELSLTEGEILDLCVTQVASLKFHAAKAGVTIRYLKPHGALYNQACRDEAYARPVVEAALQLGLPLLALPGSRLESLSKGRLPFVAEGFADRRYQADGKLVPRTQSDAMIEVVQEAVTQAERLVRVHHIRSLCVHGDNPQAVDFVRALRLTLATIGYTPRAFI